MVIKWCQIFTESQEYRKGLQHVGNVDITVRDQY